MLPLGDEARSNQNPNDRWGDSYSVKPLKDGREDQAIRDQSCFITDGNGNGFDSGKIVERPTSERILRLWSISLWDPSSKEQSWAGKNPASSPGEDQRIFPFSIRKFEMGCHSYFLYLGLAESLFQRVATETVTQSLKGQDVFRRNVAQTHIHAKALDEKLFADSLWGFPLELGDVIDTTDNGLHLISLGFPSLS